jgi:hypothetical protein
LFFFSFFLCFFFLEFFFFLSEFSFIVYVLFALSLQI